MKKTYILDTNVLIHDPGSFKSFEDNTVIIPISVIQELDKFKTAPDERGKNARVVSRKLDELRTKGKISEGVEVNGGGLVKVELDRPSILPAEFKLQEMDNRILNAAFWHKKNKNENVILITKDSNLRIKAEAIGMAAQDYESGKVKFEGVYSGTAQMEVSPEVIDELYKTKELKENDILLLPNEFVFLRSSQDAKKTTLARAVSRDPSVIKLVQPGTAAWGIKGRNREQKCAMDLLLDDSVKLVTLLGTAGTGKTLISLACGLQKSIDESVYKRLIICRSVIPVGKDIGFLPGTKEEKLTPWMGAIYDNLEFIMDRRHPDEALQHFEYLLQNEKIEIASVTHIRGRSLPKQYMIVDDAQNLTPHEIKTILSRAGEGTKVVVTGDPFQIDNPYLDIESNGLLYIVDRFKGQQIYGHMTFTKTERSDLADLVSRIL